MHRQNSMIFGTCKLHTSTSGVMQILCKFCHNKHNTLDGATYDQHDWLPLTYNFKKMICCTPANSSSLITSATYNNARVQMSTASWTCVQYVHNSPVRHPAGDASTGWYCHQWNSVTVRATPEDRLLQLLHVLELSTMVHALLQGPPNGIIHRV